MNDIQETVVVHSAAIGGKYFLCAVQYHGANARLEALFRTYAIAQAATHVLLHGVGRQWAYW